jgi:hypothetical protein
MLPDLKEAVKGYHGLREQLLGIFPELAEDEQALADTLEGISTLDEQIIEVMRYVIEREDHGRAIAERIEKLTARKRRLEEGAKALRSMVLEALMDSGLKKMVAPDFSLSVGQTKPKIIITDDRAVPDRLCKIERTPSKTMIADEFAAGRDVPGAAPSNSTPFLTIHTR